MRWQLSRKYTLYVLVLLTVIYFFLGVLNEKLFLVGNFRTEEFSTTAPSSSPTSTTTRPPSTTLINADAGHGNSSPTTTTTTTQEEVIPTATRSDDEDIDNNNNKEEEEEEEKYAFVPSHTGLPHKNYSPLLNYGLKYTVLNESVSWIPLDQYFKQQQPQLQEREESEPGTPIVTTSTTLPLSNDRYQLPILPPVDLKKYINTATHTWSNQSSKQKLMNDLKVNGFLFFLPHSGMSNQFMLFETSVINAIHSRRILVIPPIMNAHSTQYPITSCVRTNNDNHHIRNGNGGGGGAYTFYKPCELPAAQFSTYFDIIQPNNGTHVYSGPPFYYVYAKDYIQFFQNELSKVTKQEAMSDTFYAQTTVGWVYEVSYDRGSTVKCNNSTLSFISSVLKRIGVEQFIGVHLRRGDYERHCYEVLPNHRFFKSKYSIEQCYPTYDSLIQQVNELKQRLNVSDVIVIHNEKNQTLVNRMEEQGWIMEKTLWDSANVPQPHDLTIPIFDQCLMTLADYFYGNEYSSFSMRIRVMRKIIGKSNHSIGENNIKR